MDRYEFVSILKDYHWMMNSIKLLRESIIGAGERLVRQYGPESDMPKAKGGTSDPVFQEYLRREKRYGKIHEYEEKVKVIQERMHVIQDEREAEILYWMLEGKSFRWIALHMGLSHSHIQRLRINIVDQLLAYVPDVPNVPNDTKLQEHKSVV